MKRTASLLLIILGFSLNCFAQEKANRPASKKSIMINKGESYTNLWLEVVEFDNKNLPKSALAIVDSIYQKAKTENQQEQLIKTLFYKAKYQQIIEEQSFIKTIDFFKQEAELASFPNKQIIYSIIADQFWQYYQNNQWQINERTHTNNYDLDDIETWDIRTIIEEATKYYLLSLNEVNQLSRVPINQFSELIVFENTSEKERTTYLRPYLYDFLAHRAVDFFMNEIPSITQAAETFKIDNVTYFAVANDFVAEEIAIKDSSNLKNYALQILYQLSALHLNDAQKAALIDIELKRLAFAKNNATLSNKESLYFEALNALFNKYKEDKAAGEIAYAIASIHYQRGLKYNTKEGKVNKQENEKAIKICYNATQQYAGTFGAKQCLHLLDKLKEKQLNINNEQFISANKTFKTAITYKNIEKVYFKIVKLEKNTYDEWLENRNYNIDYNDYLKNKIEGVKPIRTWETNFLADNDFNTHSTEIKQEGLPLGFYILVASSNQNFTNQKATYQYSPFFVTDLAYITKSDQQENLSFFVTNRESGEPQKDVKAEVFIQTYDYKTRKYIVEKKASHTTNVDGEFKISAKDYDENNRSFYVILSKGEDILNNKEYHSIYKNYNTEERSYLQTYFYTDRAIYRPGQTICFKGIVLERKGNQNKIKSNYNTVVTFLDVNYQTIAEIAVVTNEYGSFSGSFIAPDDRLNGAMQISEQNGNHFISVEEYKRPNFEVQINPVTGTYKLNDTVTIDGYAKTYSGAALADAKVTYRVVRNGNFPRWCFYRWGYIPNTPSIEITNGTAYADENGKFALSFNALADEAIDKKFVPTYSYTVYVDATDLNGETHSTTSIVSVSEVALELSANIEGSMLKDDFDKITINSTNLNGVFEPTDVMVEVWTLESLQNYNINRKWNAPDKPLMTFDDFNTNFPHENYNDEHMVNQWKKGEKRIDKTINTQSEKDIAINTKQWKQGSYFVKLTATDKYGTTVTEENYFRLIDSQSKTPDAITFFEITDIKTTCEPVENASFLMSTAIKNLHVYYEIEKPNGSTVGKWLTLNNEQKVISIPVTEADRGNFTVHIAFVKHNQAYSYTKTITVPYTNKTLDIQFSTFRDKLQPGQTEEWSITIKGTKGEKIVAEMLAGMYDASLDAFNANTWNLDIWNAFYANIHWQTANNFNTKYAANISQNWNTYAEMPYRQYDFLNQYGYYYNGGRNYIYEVVAVKSVHYKRSAKMEDSAMPLVNGNAKIISGIALSANDTNEEAEKNEQSAANEPIVQNIASKNELLGDVKARTNFNETAFFYPQLTTDAAGNVNIKFTLPESLTKWKFMALAHTKTLQSGSISKETIAQKDLMVYPNAPRFFRENDEMLFSTKITSLSKETLNGTAQIVFYDALTNKDITTILLKESDKIAFSIAPENSTAVSWQIKVPENYSAITYKIIAKAGVFSDGEEKPIPVLSNRMLVTESLPLSVRGSESKTFTLENLKNNQSTTLKNHQLTLEFTSNPAWYAVQALPYLMEYPYDCAEQTFSRFYANAIASHIANSSPKINAVFNSWENASPDAFLSNLEKNQELKALVLEETPWVLQAKNESERKRRVGLLFNLNKMSKELNKALTRLQTMQKPSGGWPWFDGMPESRYITQHITSGMGHLDKLGIKTVRQDAKTWQMILKAVQYLDDEMLRDYKNLRKWEGNNLSENHLDYYAIQYVYMRSFFLDIPFQNKEAYNYYFGQAKKYWTAQSHYMQAMIALAMHRSQETIIANDIIASLKENSIDNEEMGMYWKQNKGFYWYEAPIETQALLIEAFSEISNDQKSIEAMKIWLLKQKQTQDWKTTKATTEACYALLLQGSDWLSNDEMVEIKVGNESIDVKTREDIKVEAGTGYFKTSWSEAAIKPEMATVSVTKKDNGVSWGALYWQYFEQLDKIGTAKTPLSIDKQLFVVKNTAKGEVIEPIDENTNVKIGEKIRVRIVIKTDRDMEYIHLKDMRASGFEPINVFSGYRYQDGLGYYETTKDASTNFFINWLAKGTYVFEYDLRANIAGNFSNGITSIQSMYAPEFSSHSAGVRVKIE